MDFDLDIFSEWIFKINLEYVWLGFNSKPNRIALPEPTKDKVKQFIDILEKGKISVYRHNKKAKSITVKGKSLRGIKR